MWGPKGTDQVKMAFDPDDADNRREGVVGLAKRDWGLQDPYLKGYAVLLSEDRDPTVRSAAVRALGASGDQTYLTDIILALHDKHEQVRWDAAVALDNVLGEEAIEPLCEKANEDSSDSVRRCSAKALRHYRKKQVIKTLARCLDDDALGVRYTAHKSLMEILGRDVGTESENWQQFAKGELPDSAPAETKKRWWNFANTDSTNSADNDE